MPRGCRPTDHPVALLHRTKPEQQPVCASRLQRLDQTPHPGKPHGGRIRPGQHSDPNCRRIKQLERSDVRIVDGHRVNEGQIVRLVGPHRCDPDHGGRPGHVGHHAPPCGQVAGRRPGHRRFDEQGEGVVGPGRQRNHGQVWPTAGCRPVGTVPAQDHHHGALSLSHGPHSSHRVLLGEGQVQVQPRQIDVAHGLGSPPHDPVRVVVDHEPTGSGLPGTTDNPTDHVGLVLHGDGARRGYGPADIGPRARVDHDSDRSTRGSVHHGPDRTGRR